MVVLLELFLLEDVMERDRRGIMAQSAQEKRKMRCFHEGNPFSRRGHERAPRAEPENRSGLPSVDRSTRGRTASHTREDRLSRISRGPSMVQIRAAAVKRNWQPFEARGGIIGKACLAMFVSLC